MNMDSLLPDAVMATVPHWLGRLHERGGPSQADWDWLELFGDDLGEHGDVLLYKGKKAGETAAMFNKFCRAVAIMAFIPGGVTLFGKHWEVKEESKNDP